MSTEGKTRTSRNCAGANAPRQFSVQADAMPLGGFTAQLIVDGKPLAYKTRICATKQAAMVAALQHALAMWGP